MSRNYSDRGSSDQEKSIFAERLNYYIGMCGKTQLEVAKDLGYNASTVNTWCKGKAMPTAGKIQKLADYFLIGKTDLLEEHSDVPDFVPGTAELIDLYSKSTPEQRQAVISLLRSFVSTDNSQ